jgi:hypothetical protein
MATAAATSSSRKRRVALNKFHSDRALALSSRHLTVSEPQTKFQQILHPEAQCPDSSSRSVPTNFREPLEKVIAEEDLFRSDPELLLARHTRMVARSPRHTPQTLEEVLESTPNRLQQDEKINENAQESTTRTGNQLMSLLRPFNYARTLTGKIVNDSRVQTVLLLMIIVNAIMMGVATFPTIKNDPDIKYIFELTDRVFLIIFTVESGMQLIYHGWNLFKDGFLVFDMSIVVISWTLDGSQVVRAFRIFRAFRLITRVELLRELVVALFSVIPKMTAILTLLCLIFYIFSVMFTQLFKGMFEDGLLDRPYFETLFDSAFTLFQMMTFVSACGMITHAFICEYSDGFNFYTF